MWPTSQVFNIHIGLVHRAAGEIGTTETLNNKQGWAQGKKKKNNLK